MEWFVFVFLLLFFNHGNADGWVCVEAGVLSNLVS